MSTALVHTRDNHRPSDAAIAACKALLGSAIKGDHDAARELAAIPSQAWPDTTMRETARHIVELTTDGAALELPILLHRLAVGGKVSTGDVSALATVSPVYDVEEVANIIRGDYREREGRHLADLYLRGGITAPDLQAKLAELDTPDTAGKEPVRIELSNVADAGPMPTPIFTCGVYRSKYGCLQAVSNGGKTFLALELAASVALGREIFSEFVPHVKGRVFVATGEDDGPALKPRLQAIAAAQSIPYDEIDTALRDGRLQFWCGAHTLATFERDGIRPTKWFTALQKHIEAERYDIVIIDPENSYFAYTDSNAQGQKSAVAGLLMELAESSGAALLITQHTGKARKDDLDQTAAGGSLALANHARWVLNLRAMDADTAQGHDITELDRRKYAEAQITKNSYGPLGDSFFLQRVSGGALVDVELRKARLERIAGLLCDEIRDRGAELTEREIVSRQEGKAIRDALKGTMGAAVSRTDIEKAIVYALQPERGFPMLKFVSGGPNSNGILVPTEAHTRAQETNRTCAIKPECAGFEGT